jgi:Tfp pilus assembly protein PilF
MIPERFRFFVSSVMFILLMVCLSISSWAEEPCENWVGKIVSVQGSVEARKVSKTHWDPVRLNDTYCIGDMIRVQKNSRAALVLINGATLRLDQGSTIIFSRIEKKETLFLRLLKGAAHFFSRIPHALKLATPFVNGGVEGTEFFVRVDENKTFISIFDGKVLASNAAGSLALTSGQSAIAEAGKAPVPHVVVHPRDAVQWALYYPPVIYGKAPAEEDTHDPRFLIYQASTLLSVGRVDEARSNINQALKADPKYGDAIALQSIIAVVQNEKGKALDLARQAVETDPKSATARIGLSYAQQANFDLQGALNSLKESVRLAPENALAWARLAELWSSFGELDKALNAAQKAVALDPNLSRTQSVLGFAYLTQVETKKSKKAFEKAIELDQADSLPRLGLGLAKIREGDLKDGGKEIEIAASLDPSNALIRSYLGKVYFEEKRKKLDGREYAVAKELDPLDPTPYFYDAIRKQTVNRPVEALQDLQKAIELNDNRAVYRSRLLLDEDLASRSASLGRIYSNLGFQQRALVEGWKSVNTDPGNYSAHRFLADSYSALPRHEIARVSELLQSQLLQPINITPIQPQLAESSLSILEGSGPSAPSFNEFNPLFQRNRMALQADAVVGGKDTRGNDLVFSGVYGKGSFSVGQFHYETEGFRENNDQNKNIYNVFAQVSLSPKTSIQAEYRNTNSKFGDLSLRFDPANYTNYQRQKEQIESLRIGFRHAFTPNSEIIGNINYGDSEGSVEVDLEFIEMLPLPFPFPPIPVDGNLDADVKVKEDGYLAEVRHLFQSELFQLTGGIGYYSGDSKTETTNTITLGPPISSTTIDPLTEEQDIRYTNLYVYSLINYPKNITWTVGGSADFLEGAIVDSDQFNPKLGLTWNPLPATTLRTAVFRTIKRTLISSQTIEPTQVAGFNQFFDYGEGTDSWHYGIAIDQKFSATVYGGAEFSRRDMEVPWKSLNNLQVQEGDREENLARAYLYWTPLKLLAVTGEYWYEQMERGPENVGSEEFTKIDTHRLSLGTNFFHPSGFSAGLKATYIDQEGDFGNPKDNTLVSGSDQFWVVDAQISYRIPNRFGIITLVAKNLFDQEFKFQDTDPANPDIYPERVIFAKITLAF